MGVSRIISPGMESPSVGKGRNEEMRWLEVAIWETGTGDKSHFKLQVELEKKKPQAVFVVCLFKVTGVLRYSNPDSV